MRVPAARTLALARSHRRPLTCYTYQRAAIRSITSRPSPEIYRKRQNSTLAVEQADAREQAVLLGKSSNASQSQSSPFQSQGERICASVEWMLMIEHITVFAATALTPLEQYHRLVASGTLRPDDHQTRIIEKLQRLHDDLEHYEPPPLPGAESSSLVRPVSLSNAQRCH